MKIGICICEKVNGLCTTIGCFKVYNEKQASFSIYQDMDVELSAFITCNACSSKSFKGLEEVVQAMDEREKLRIHLGVCTLGCPAKNLDKIRDVFTSRNIELVDGTH